MKNLIFTFVFNDKRLIYQSNILIKSLRKYGNLKNTDLILFTNLSFVNNNATVIQIDNIFTSLDEIWSYKSKIINEFNFNCYDKIMYIDSDIYCIDDINPLFNVINNNFCVAIETHKKILNAGTWGINNYMDFLTIWNNSISVRQKEKLNDQVVLNELYKLNEYKINIFPPDKYITFPSLYNIDNLDTISLLHFNKKNRTQKIKNKFMKFCDINFDGNKYQLYKNLNWDNIKNFK